MSRVRTPGAFAFSASAELMPNQPVDDPRLRQAVDLFNAREYFACHDVLEEIWSETLADDRTFYQGLIHASVALFHFEGGNLGGARKMYRSTVRYLSPFVPRHAGIDLEAFLPAFEDCFAELLALHSAVGSDVALRPELIPTWGAANGDEQP